MTCIISFGAEQYQNCLFNVHVERNVVYAENVPHLAKKHFITTLALGLNSPSGEKNNLHFFQNAEETVDGVLNADIYSPKRDISYLLIAWMSKELFNGVFKIYKRQFNILD